MSTGWLTLSPDKDAVMNLDSCDWMPIESATDLPVLKVLACGKAVTFITDSEEVWGMGKKVQGIEIADRGLRKINKPSCCKNFKKVVQA